MGVDERSRKFLDEAAAHAESAQKLIDDALERARRSVIDLRDPADVDVAPAGFGVAPTTQVPVPRASEPGS